jgi:hypothetical protein
MQCLGVHYKPVSNHFSQEGGGGVKSVRGDWEQQGGDFCPTYVQEFGLRTFPI